MDAFFGVEQIRVAVLALETAQINEIAPAQSSGIGVAQRNILTGDGIGLGDSRHRTDHHQSGQRYEHGYRAGTVES
jgi:hypothetical protein